MKKATWIRTAILVGAVGALELACDMGVVPATMVISPSAMVLALVKTVQSDDFGSNVERTFSAVAIAMRKLAPIDDQPHSPIADLLLVPT